MIRTVQTLFNSALYGVMALALLAGAGVKAEDAIATVEKGDKEAGIAAPGIVETKAIAEEAFICPHSWASLHSPPVNSFWSVTIYDGKTQLLIKNPINRYLINSPMLPDMKKNADGSLTLYIQNDSPGEDKEANWLPAPKDTIYLVMRLYWPKIEAPSILPAGAGSWNPPGIVQVK